MPLGKKLQDLDCMAFILINGNGKILLLNKVRLINMLYSNLMIEICIRAKKHPMRLWLILSMLFCMMVKNS
jgi:hypothetical protein